ncbi:hypothetical protein RchiOBHm_Chr3g0487371 [Rosa chinensis]|uniref:Uncharacterized protein n=1 Tax=Rosa chinensis TaxID=74649 RepID=A0A2P6RFG4_ROSCH|nr:hypothetical protein RchiOBHm_Chr3g0487371 [Rosa chinensis]
MRSLSYYCPKCLPYTVIVVGALIVGSWLLGGLFLMIDCPIEDHIFKPPPPEFQVRSAAVSLLNITSRPELTPLEWHVNLLALNPNTKHVRIFCSTLRASLLFNGDREIAFTWLQDISFNPGNTTLSFNFTTLLQRDDALVKQISQGNSSLFGVRVSLYYWYLADVWVWCLNYDRRKEILLKDVPFLVSSE